MEPNFWINQTVKFFFLHALAFAEGIAATRWGLKVNYTRKIHHFMLFLCPYIFIRIIPYHETIWTMFAGPVISLLTMVIYIKPLRERFRFIAIMFASFDRPEDRPHTLKWLFTQYLGTFATAIPLALFLRHYGLQDLMIIIILINGIGDGLAEPVGVKWGKHKYLVKALFTFKMYTRSYEGSACVFITSCIVLLYFSNLFTPLQLSAALLLMPAAMTLAEAKSPHTWDSPLLFLTGGICISCIKLLLV